LRLSIFIVTPAEPVVNRKSIGDLQLGDLYVFSRFFAISSQDEADAYADEFKENDLARELIQMYNTSVENIQSLQAIENKPYFVQRLNEAQLEEARAEAEAKGIAIGEAKGIAIGEAKGADQLAKLIRDGYDLDTALKIVKKEE
jgi:hypothetical protein